MLKRCSTIFFVIAVVLISCGREDEKNSIPLVKDGVLDLRNYKFEKSIIPLNGEWEFYWKELITPKEFTTRQAKPKHYFSVPSYWNDKVIDGVELSGQSYATYRLKILSNKLNNISIYINEQMTSYTLWNDTNLLFKCGKVSSAKTEAVPLTYPIIKEINLSKDTSELIFQVSNFHHKNGGFSTAPKIGFAKNIRFQRSKSIAIDIFIFGCILVISLFNFSISITHRGTYYALFFGFFALFLAFNTITSDSLFLSSAYSKLNWYWQFRLNKFAIFAIPTFLVAFLYAQYKNEISIKLVYINIGLNIIFMLSLFLSTYIVSHLIQYFYIVTLLASIYYIHRLIVAVIRKRNGAVLLLIGIFLFTIESLITIFRIEYNLASIPSIFPLGTLTLVLGQTYLFAQDLVKLYADNDAVKLKLASQNEELEQIVKKQTEELKQQQKDILLKNDKLELHNEEIGNKNKELITQRELLAYSESKIRSFVQLLPESIFEIDNEGYLVFANNEFYNSTDYSKDDRLSINDFLVLDNIGEDSVARYMSKQMQSQKILREFRSNIRRKDNSIFPVLMSVAHENQDDVVYRCAFIDITERISDEQTIRNASKEIEIKNKKITDSLLYASTIQNAVMPPIQLWKDTFIESFIMNKPHSIVSGDFYFLQNKGDKVVFSLSDCTGHGVPGGFMTMLGLTFLKQIYSDDNFLSPELALDMIRDKVISNLHQGNNQDTFSNQDGMDMILCILDKQTLMLEYASAKQTMFIVREGKLTLFKGDRMPIGIYPSMKNFSLHKVQLQKNDVLYLFSDGVVNIFGGENNKQLFSKGLQNIIMSCWHKKLDKQKEIIEGKLDDWQGDNEQIDDMLLFGIKI